MSPEQALYMVMVDAGMKIRPGTLDSLREALEDGNIYFFGEGEPEGFLTWYFDLDTLVVNNLCLMGSGSLFSLRSMFHKKYPNLKKVMWYDDKRGRNIEYGFEQDESNSRPVTATEISGR